MKDKRSYYQDRWSENKILTSVDIASVSTQKRQSEKVLHGIIFSCCSRHFFSYPWKSHHLRNGVVRLPCRFEMKTPFTNRIFFSFNNFDKLILKSVDLMVPFRSMNTSMFSTSKTVRARVSSFTDMNISKIFMIVFSNIIFSLS